MPQHTSLTHQNKARTNTLCGHRQNWSIGAPENNTGKNNLVGWVNGTQWADLPDNYVRFSIVEYDGMAVVPVPGSGLLLIAGIGGLAIASKRRRKRG
ncbi:VPLPA-CTERM sorting domain-containing protein [Antarctobacter sp.]|uniref:VPLPA-CTERM sorting domain-containing protein n=1 Tax=Antarctobacter sp. TaxID=1872577 RepID=UPI002B26CF69|nr:VPLPA-CTERM sorting domain-containing protein [Antarctobacter sp.]